MSLPLVVCYVAYAQTMPNSEVGGAIVRWGNAGVAVVDCVLTDGETGLEFNSVITPHRKVTMRVLLPVGLKLDSIMPLAPQTLLPAPRSLALLAPCDAASVAE